MDFDSITDMPTGTVVSVRIRRLRMPPERAEEGVWAVPLDGTAGEWNVGLVVRRVDGSRDWVIYDVLVPGLGIMRVHDVRDGNGGPSLVPGANHGNRG